MQLAVRCAPGLLACADLAPRVTKRSGAYPHEDREIVPRKTIMVANLLYFYKGWSNTGFCQHGGSDSHG